MRGYILLILASILLLLASDAVAAQMGRDSDGMGPGGMGPGGMGPGGMGHRQMGHNMWEQGKSIRADNNMHGMGFMHSAGNAYGNYVTFNITDDGDVLYYTIAGDSLFNITFEPFDFQSQTVRGRSSVTTLVGDSTLIQLHDNPAGVINILPGEDITVTFEVASYVNVSHEEEYVQLESENVTGYIIGVGEIDFSVTDDEVTVEAGPNSTVIFRAPPVNVPDYGMHRGFAQGIAQNRIGLEVALGANETYDVVNYSRNMRLEVQEMTEERIRMQVNSTDPESRVISINLDNTSLEIRERQRLRIHFDEQPLNCMDNPEAVLNGTGTGTGQPLCWVSPVQNRSATCLMYIPNFSVHTIELTTEEEEMTPTPGDTTTIPTTAEAPPTESPTAQPSIPGFEIAGTLAVLVAAALILHRRKP